MLFYAAALQTLNYDWDTLALNSYKIVYSRPQLSGPPWFDRSPIRAQKLAR